MEKASCECYVIVKERFDAFHAVKRPFGGLSRCVPSINDSLEVEVLYPA
jgi:hypothetical protein